MKEPWVLGGGVVLKEVQWRPPGRSLGKQMSDMPFCGPSPRHKRTPRRAVRYNSRYPRYLPLVPSYQDLEGSSPHSTTHLPRLLQGLPAMSSYATTFQGTVFSSSTLSSTRVRNIT